MDIFLNKKGGTPAIAVALIVLLVIFMLATAVPALKETILQILGAV